VASYQIHGGKKLTGTIQTNTSKNSALACMYGCLLTNEDSTLENVPKIEEIERTREVFHSLGVKTEWENSNLKINPPEKLNWGNLNQVTAACTRVSLYLIPVLARQFEKFSLPYPGGCRLGKRTISPLIYALEKLGFSINLRKGQLYVQKSQSTTREVEIVMYESSDTGTIAVAMAAALSSVQTTIKFASANYQVQDLCLMLQKMGARIEDIGTTTLKIQGNPPCSPLQPQTPRRCRAPFTAAVEQQGQTLTAPKGSDPVIDSLSPLTKGVSLLSPLTKGVSLLSPLTKGVSLLSPLTKGGLRGVCYPIMPDPIESMFLIALACCTNSTLTIQGCPKDFLELELLKLEKMGFQFEILKTYLSANQHFQLVDLQTFPSRLVAPVEKLYGRPYPGLNIDNLPFFVPVATQAHGTTLIHDWVFENRAIYFMEFQRLGANLLLADPHRVFITGKTTLHSEEIVCPPALRPASVLLIGMLMARGKSILRNTYSIDRGYENLYERLRQLGARIEEIE